MRRKLLLWIAPWIAFSLGACATVPLIETAKACAEWRWIGIRNAQEDTCPEIPGWDLARPLFDSPERAYTSRYAYGYEKEETVPDAASEALEQLERFCVYETDKKLGKVPFPPTASGKLARVDQDCAALSVAASTAWQPFSDDFLAQAGKPKARLAIQNKLGVRLAFLDTHPTGEEVPTAPPTEELTSEHGYTLAHIARNLICSPEESNDCAAQITTQLALPIQKFDPKSRKGTHIVPGQGGSIGTQSDLARAIRNEVDAWRADLQRRGADAPQHLVLNLSVAWNGELFGGLHEQEVAEMRAGTQAVYWALRYAQGFDVLVLAAAGNAQACKRGSEGPLLPAAWEQEAPITCGEPPTTPLLYAVGGVDSQGRPLANARPEGMPRRAAFGAAAVVPGLTPGHSTNMYTGTSVSTAVVSSIAAIVWDTLPPNSKSSKVMEIIDGSGDNLSDLRTNFWFRTSPAGRVAEPPVRRISLCAALEAVCTPGAVGCPLQSPCAAWPLASNLSLPTPRWGRCQPWVHTQPPDQPCPVCEPPRN